MASESDFDAVCADLVAEALDLQRLLEPLPGSAWGTLTPSPGWTISHQISHLMETETHMLEAIRDPATFRMQAADYSTEPAVDVFKIGTDEYSREVLTGWTRSRTQLDKALADLEGRSRIPWFGPSMSAMTAASSRVMEVWAHGQDIADSLGISRARTSRIRHVAHLGVVARKYSYTVHGLNPPSDPVHVSLIAPDGTTWQWGPESSPQRVTGSAWDFSLLVTRRRHRDDCELFAKGAEADEWLDIAQAFAGAPGPGRQPKSTSQIDPL
ncbi:TIGR03084 family metal-binding protein [Pseudarthrobacter sp. NPDC058329]|uniref:TIGR03084 family metal-binding protein n=1 Tax=Pseudarthrobacter sp. NPDC058329 TaxID=3346448 RepID=UPI0036D893B8